MVTVLSNYLDVKPYHSVKRYEKNRKAMVNVDQPDAIFQYNKRMGGVDLFDNAISNYRIKIRGKKWYWPLITNGLDAAMVNGWKLYCAIDKYKKDIASSSISHRKRKDKRMPQLQFRIEVTEALLQVNNVAVARGPKTPDTLAQKRLRTDKIGHEIAKRLNRIRCRQCHSHTIYFCPKCKAAMHPKCFVKYHDTLPQ